MQDSFTDRVKQYRYKTSWRRSRRVLVSVLACVVVLCTSYALILPALTAEKLPVCGLEEHTHTDECYERVRGKLICGKTESEGHIHTEECYKSERVLKCTLKEGPGHTHTAECYDKDGKLICGLEEYPAHTHTDECYTIEKKLVCGKTEGEGAHRHTDECYEWSRGKLICGKKEHIHGPECYRKKTREMSAETDGIRVDVRGKLPLGGINFSAESLTAGDISFGGGDVLFALNLEINGADGEVYEPAEGEKLSVSIDAPEFDTEKVKIFYLPENGEAVDMHAQAKRGAVSFKTTHFSTYVGVGIPEEPVILAEGDYTDSNNNPTGAHWQYMENTDRTHTFRAFGSGEIPDYARADQSPAFHYKGEADRIVIDEGITKVGQRAFYGGTNDTTVSEISLSSTVKSIGWECFFGCVCLESVEIPGTVEELKGRAFGNCSNLSSVTLGEGLKRIYGDPFLSPSGCGGTITIPASVTTIEGTPGATFGMTGFENIVVAEGNRKYMSEDSVIYENLPDGKRRLVSFPCSRTGEFTCPDDVTSIASHAFSGSNLRKLTVPGTVQDVQGSAFRFSKIEEIYIADGAKGSGSWLFVAADNLTKVRLPDNFTTVGSNMFYVTKAIEKVQVPLGLQSCGGMFDGTVSIREILYNANLTDLRDPFWNTSVLDTTLIVGNKVDALPAEFNLFAKHAADGEVLFEPNNAFTAAPGAFADAPEPAKNIEGNIYVDENGLVYSYDTETDSAVLLFVPERVPRSDSDGVVTYTYPSSVSVPAVITPEPGSSFNVTKVVGNALRYCPSLTSISFGVPGTITLAPYALANCPSLASVNGVTTIEDAEALFIQPIGTGAFYNTGLGGAQGPESFEQDMNGSRSLTVVSSGAPDMIVNVASAGHTMVWVPENEGAEVGGYKLLTGDSMNVTVSVGNTDAQGQNFVYRLYVQKTGDGGSVGITPGKSYNFDGQPATCYATSDPNTVCLEFVPGVGRTVSMPVTVLYPSPQSAGGGFTFWGEIKPSSEAGGLRLSPEPPESSQKIQASWSTDKDPFSLEKNGSAAAVSLRSYLEEDGVVIRPTEKLLWIVKLTRTIPETSAFGKDYSSSIDFEDRITLPDKFEWDPKLIEAINGGHLSIRTADGGYVISAGGEQVFTVGKSPAMSSLRVTWDSDSGCPVLHWHWRNMDSSTEIEAMQIGVSLCPKAIRLRGEENVSANESVTVNNAVSARIHYTHSTDVNKSASADNTLVGDNGRLAITKTATSPRFFGESVDYTVRVYNTGALPWLGEDGKNYFVQDDMVVQLRVSPENMESMFAEADRLGTPLTVTVKNASLARYEVVTATDGVTVSYRHSGNSQLGPESLSGTVTLTITKSGGMYSVAVSGSGAPTENVSLPEALKAVGFADTVNSKYSFSWLLGEGSGTVFPSGGEKVYHIPANVKDSFGMLASDWPNEYPTENNVSHSNTVKVCSCQNGNSTLICNTSVSGQVKREAIVYKAVYKDGHDISRAPLADNGDVLDYKLAFDHFGTGEYHDLPMVDTITGSQYLLVPVNDNSALAGRGLETYSCGDVPYYKLGIGEYTNVKVGIDENGTLLNAASVTVSEIPDDEEHTDQGLATTIKWYFASLPGEQYRKTVRYKTFVDVALTHNYAWCIGNTVWMNDKPTHRIFDALWGSGTLIDFEKKIVETRGGLPSSDVVYEDDHSVVGRGESVTYRLKLYNKADYPYVLSGADIADALPHTYNIFEWVKDNNVRLSGTVNEADAVLTGLDSWFLSDDPPAGIIDDGRRFIRWGSNASISFPRRGAVYLYFTLTFPDNSEENAVWSNYAAIVGGGMIDNTFYVYRFPSIVMHDLKETGRAMLQKGVLSLSYEDSLNKNYLIPNSSRRYYNNRDAKKRCVSYYVALCNTGINRLYLSDVYDALPDGFTFSKLNGVIDNPGSGYEEHRDYPGTENLVSLPAGITVMSAVVTAHNDGNEPLHFSFSAGSGSKSNALKYDSDKQMFYLGRNEAFVFSYLCYIGVSAETADIAVNTAGMYYTDNLHAGVNVPGKTELFCVGNEPDVGCIDNNDGSRLVLQASQAVSLGFPADEGQWLCSDVKLLRGEIIPGITKFTESYVDSNNHVVPYENFAPQDSVVNWKARLDNSGTLTVVDYTFTDIMPFPYIFTGKVSAHSFDAAKRLLIEKDYFEILSVTLDENGRRPLSVKIKVLEPNTDRRNQEFELAVGDAPLQVRYNAPNNPILLSEISFARDTEDNLKLILHIVDPEMSITETGGYCDINISGMNPSTVYNNEVYMNKAEFKPESQPFNSVSKGSGIRDGEGNLSYVSNSAPVTVAFGYATASSKAVAEKDISPPNIGLSNDPDNNTVLLSSAYKLFNYTLTVENVTDNAMSKLVLIDTLPDIGDTSPFDADVPRNSEFKVVFADVPAVRVTVTPLNGQPYELNTSQYTVEYSTSTTFGGTQSQDWKGESSGTAAVWGEFTREARSLRVTIRDDTGTVIPAKSLVEVSFDAQASGEVLPGSIAWNSFGYHYALVDISTELEAMPLPVGVKVPSVPKLRKKLTDLDGNPIAADTEYSFVFRISDNSDPANTKDITLTVPAGESELTLTLDKNVMGEDWLWNSEKSYTVQELNVLSPWETGEWTGGDADTDGKLNFVYEPGRTLVVTCSNVLQIWSLTLSKVEYQHPENVLAGVTFAFYSPDSADAMGDSVYDALEFSPMPERTLDFDGQSWFLTDVQLTGTDGKISFTGLKCQNCLLVELTPPDGFYALAEPLRVSREHTETRIAVENTRGYALPATGGRGTLLYTLGGFSLMLSAFVIILCARRKRKGEVVD